MRNLQNQINSLKGEVKNEIKNTMKTQQAVLMNQQDVFQTNLQNMLSGFFQNQASLSNTLPNPKGETKEITTQSSVAYEGPSIPTNPSPKKVVERETGEATDKEQTNFQGSTAHIPPPVNPIPFPEPDVPKTLPKPNISYPSRRNDQKSRDKASNQIEKIFQIFQDLRFDISFADALLLMPRFAPTIRNLLMNKEKLLELAKIPLNENCSAMLLKKLPEKLGYPGKFLIPCNFSGMDDLDSGLLEYKESLSRITLDEEQLAFLADPGDRADSGPDTQTLPTTAIFQTDVLDAFDSDCDEAPYYSKQPAFVNDLDIKITSDSNIISYDQYVKENESKVVQVAKCNAVNQENKTVNESLTAELDRYKEQVKIFEERQKFDLNDREKYIDSQMRVQKYDLLSMIDFEETLDLAEVIRLKMNEKQNDPIMKEKRVNINPIDYGSHNELYKHFVPKKQLSVEKAFWLPISKTISEQTLV
ncbi:hypothetical protein Tco_1051840 [Tanacetum coccineum]